MNKLLEELRRDFQGNADALILKAQELAKTLLLEQDGSEGNERLLRHYVSIGVVDKPSREGRDALYGFRHLVQFVAARRLLAEGFSLAKIAKFTSVVPTDALTAYLENPDRTSEAELLVAVFRSEASSQGSSAHSDRRAAAPKPMSGMATGMGVVDVMHEMREMERRVHQQLTGLQSRVHGMLEDILSGLKSQAMVQSLDPRELEFTARKLTALLEETHQRWDFLAKRVAETLEKQRYEFLHLIEEQAKRAHESVLMQRSLHAELNARLDRFEAEMTRKRVEREEPAQGQPAKSQSVTTKENGAV